MQVVRTAWCTGRSAVSIAPATAPWSPKIRSLPSPPETVSLAGAAEDDVVARAAVDRVRAADGLRASVGGFGSMQVVIDVGQLGARSRAVG